MAHFYFHLSAPGEYFADNVGYDVSDPGAVHYIALRLADRVMIGSPTGRDSATCSFRRLAASVKSLAAIKAAKLVKARSARRNPVRLCLGLKK
jgi:hypothetical protein